jgi:hypothetical protein
MSDKVSTVQSPSDATAAGGQGGEVERLQAIVVEKEKTIDNLKEELLNTKKLYY